MYIRCFSVAIALAAASVPATAFAEGLDNSIATVEADSDVEETEVVIAEEAPIAPDETEGSEEVEESASPLTGFISLKTAYLDDNTLSYTPDQLVVQGGLTVQVTENFYLDSWGSHGVENDIGAELDVGAFYVIPVGEETEVVISGYRYFLVDAPDTTAVSVGVTHGAFDITATYYEWSLEDVVRVSAGYTIEPTDNLSVRPVVTYETAGFGARELSIGGDASYAIWGPFSLEGGVRTDFHDVRGVLSVTAAF